MHYANAHSLLYLFLDATSTQDIRSTQPVLMFYVLRYNFVS